MEDGNILSQFGVSSTLTTTAKADISLILSSCPEVSQPPVALPGSRECDHHIVLKSGAQPVSVRPYRYNHIQKDEKERLVTEMLAVGIIQPSSSLYSSPVLLVRKKDGSWHFCVDYRELNKLTVLDKYPIPVI